MSDEPRDPSSDPFLADLVAGFDPESSGDVVGDHGHEDDGLDLAIRRDHEIAIVQAWAAGPAGIASLGLDHGITVVLDAALPHRVVGATIAPPDTDALRRLDPLLGSRTVDALVDTGDTGGEWRPVRGRPRETTESVAIGRYVLLADEAGRFRRAYPNPVARAAFGVELAAMAPCSLANLLGDRLLEWAIEAAEGMVALEETGRLIVPGGTAAQRLALALREVEATIDRLSALGDNPLADRRFARQLTPLAERIEQGRYIDERTAESPDLPLDADDDELQDDSEVVPAEVGRAACRHERQGDEAAAAAAWQRCAERWIEAGDEMRAEAARLYATGSLGDAAPIAGAPESDRQREDLVRVRSKRSAPARFGWLRARDDGPEPEQIVIRRSRHEVTVGAAVDRLGLLAPFIADDLS